MRSRKRARAISQSSSRWPNAANRSRRTIRPTPRRSRTIKKAKSSGASSIARKSWGWACSTDIPKRPEQPQLPPVHQRRRDCRRQQRSRSHLPGCRRVPRLDRGQVREARQFRLGLARRSPQFDLIAVIAVSKVVPKKGAQDQQGIKISVPPGRRNLLPL